MVHLFVETIVGDGAGRPTLVVGLQPGFQPARASIRDAVEIRNIGFDVQQRRTVQHVHASYQNPVPVDLEQTHNGDADWVGPSR